MGLTVLQWMTLVVFFVTIAAVVVNKLDATVIWTWSAGISTRFLCSTSGCQPRMASITKKPTT